MAAVLKKEQLFHAQSRSPSVSSESSGFSFSFSLPSELMDASISSPEWWAANQEGGGNQNSSILVKKDQPQSSVGNSSPKATVASKPFLKRDLKAEDPKLRFHHRGATSLAEDSSKNSPRTGSSTPRSKGRSPTVAGNHHLESPNWPDYAIQESYPLPLPPGTSFKSFPVSDQNSAEWSPAAAASHSPERAEAPRSNGTHWKRGKLQEKGILGDVYLGFIRYLGYSNLDGFLDD